MAGRSISYLVFHLLPLFTILPGILTVEGENKVPQTTFFIGDPQRHSDVKEPLYILGFFTIRGPWAKTCGAIDPEYGFQTFLGFKFALERVRQNPDFDGVTLNGLVVDTCSSYLRVTHDLYELVYGPGLTYVDSNTGLNASLTLDNTVAVLTIGSDNTFPAVEVLAPRHVMTLSPSGTSVGLQGKPFLLRNAPPSSLQGPVMVDVLRHFGWTYVGLVLSDHEFAHTAVTQLLEAARARLPALCVARTVLVSVGAGAGEVSRAVRELGGLAGLRVVLLYTADPLTRLVLRAAAGLGRFTWVSSLWWGDERHIIQGLEAPALGAITLQVWSEPSWDFLAYVGSLTLDDHGAIPDQWFQEFWQQTFHCRLDQGRIMRQYTTPCQPHLRLSTHVITQNAFALHTIIATQMVAQGLHNVGSCDPASPDFFTCFRNTADRHALVFEGTKKATWTGNPQDFNSTFKFNQHGFGNKGFNILNLQKMEDESYEYVIVGTASTTSPSNINADKFKWYDDLGEVMTSHPQSECPSAEVCMCVNSDFSQASFAAVHYGNRITQFVSILLFVSFVKSVG